MTTKEQVLQLLKKNGNLFISGQEMAEELFVTRASVWKAVKTLQNEGFNIEAVTNRGYRLLKDISAPEEKHMLEYLQRLNSDIQNIELRVYDTVDSTNEQARRMAGENPDKTYIIVADRQTAGRGRRGREFFSPSGTGIYISFLLYPETDLSDSMTITCMMAECLRRAIGDVTGLDCGIKWVNDIFYNDRKVAGVLTEGFTSLEDGRLEYLIVGAGINVYEPIDGFPEAIRETAGALLKTETDNELKNKLCASIIDHFLKCYLHPDENRFMSDYRNHSILPGKYIKINRFNRSTQSGREYAYVTGIDDNGHLCVRYDDGKEETLFTGEVSVVKY